MLAAHARLRAHVAALVGERHPVTGLAALKHAEAYLRMQLEKASLQLSAHALHAFGTTFHNIVADRPGSRREPPLLIAAHYDTVAGSPGADDNASGLAVMLELAARLAPVPLARPVRFIAFCLEEHQLLGSLAYAAELRRRQAAIQGAIVLECVGYTAKSQTAPPGVPVAIPSTGDFLAVVGNETARELVHAIGKAAQQLAPPLKLVPLVVPGQGEQLPDTRRSDHAAFWHHGYPAVMVTDTANFRNPHYHRPTDLPDTLDYAFLEQVARTLEAAVLQLAGPPASR